MLVMCTSIWTLTLSITLVFLESQSLNTRLKFCENWNFMWEHKLF